MKKKVNEIGKDELQSEYDFSSMAGGVQGKYAARYKAGRNFIHRDPDVAAVFPDDESVNEALRSLMDIARKKVPAPVR